MKKFKSSRYYAYIYHQRLISYNLYGKLYTDATMKSSFRRNIYIHCFKSSLSNFKPSCLNCFKYLNGSFCFEGTYLRDKGHT